MNTPKIDRIVDAVLYEGYILYPYRPSVKNFRRWTFGGLFPRAYCDAHAGEERSAIQIECLAIGDRAARLDVEIRFLQIVDRQVGRVAATASATAMSPTGRVATLAEEPALELVESLEVDGKQYVNWQEAIERRIAAGGETLAELSARPQSRSFTFPASCEIERLQNSDDTSAGAIIRRRRSLAGSIEISALPLSSDCFRVTVRVVNNSVLPGPVGGIDREDAQRQSLASTHAILTLHGGQFISPTDPPVEFQLEASQCRNDGVWPVLVGDPAMRDRATYNTVLASDTLLASPIILEDFPQIAPQSAGDFFDATEIDEMLALRIMTMTDAEQLAMSGLDRRARDLLARARSLGPSQLATLHGAGRMLQPLSEPTHDGR